MLSSIQVNANPHTKVRLTFQQNLPKGKEFIIEVNQIVSCDLRLDSNLYADKKMLAVKIYKALPIAAGDILISEILFNPKVGSTDFIEIYNNSNKILDISDLSIGNATQTIKITKVNLIHPKAYWVLTKDIKLLQKAYYLPNPQQVVEISNLPAYINETGQVKLKQGSILIDSFSYHQQMHYPLFRNVKGLSLERSDFNLPTNYPGNFKSSSSLHGGASPTYQNSQFLPFKNKDSIFLSAKVFSPNADGYEDELIIQYQFPQGDWTGKIEIYHANGKRVRQLSNQNYFGKIGEIS
ncbi:MAG: lamin tail domain-containing protein [Pedobacter sp.]|nr:MAG: lamin tail domain-containing protein [Pedobacter sp.]